MSYIFESKRDLLYFKNYVALRASIDAAGGDGEYVIKEDGEELLNKLARNNIELNPRVVTIAEEELSELRDRHADMLDTLMGDNHG